MPKQTNTTYIFGAGASFRAGYPFIAAMGQQLFQWMKKPGKATFFDFADFAEALEVRFGDNIDSVFNGLAAEIKRRGPDYLTFANCYRPALVEAMRQWFAEIHRRHNSLAYERFAREIVKPGDEIVTFNYDVSLDSQLRRFGKWCVGDGYGFLAQGLPCGSAVRVLKLHGSVNWFALMFQGMTGNFAAPAGVFGDRPAFTKRDLSALGYIGTVDPLFPRQGSGAIQPLIFPTNRKQFFFETNFFGREWSQFRDRLWRKARNAFY